MHQEEKNIYRTIYFYILEILMTKFAQLANNNGNNNPSFPT